MSNTTLVLNFIAAWEARDVETIMACFAEGALYHNIPMPKLTGHAQIRGFIGPFVGQMKEVAWEVLHVAENAAGTVLTERIDRFVMHNGTEICIEVMGTFELKDGKITAWRDYFDLKSFMDQKIYP